MSPPQYFRIATEILSRAPCRVLVVGAGRDTPLYAAANPGGRTVVLEHNPRWLKAIEKLACTGVRVSYCTRLADGPLDDCPLPQGVPPWVLDEHWDVILVDSPAGFRSDQPGRQQSILLAAAAAKAGTTVFLHDFDRPAERAFAGRYLRKPEELIGRRQTLAVFRYPSQRSGRSVTRVPEPIDVLYLFRHSGNRDREILYSLRSVARHAPFVRKVWIFGDRPGFLSDDKSLVEHVPHDYLAPLFGYRTPLRSDFLMLFLASLIPELTPQFVRFSDDYVILRPLSREQFLTVRALEDLNLAQARGRGKFKEAVWRTYDILKHYGFAGINFESHTPQPYSKRLALEAFLAFREFLREDRYKGMLAPTSLYNYALKHHGLRFVWLAEEQPRAGFYGRCPPLAQIAAECRGKLFLNYDDRGFGPPMLEYLRQMFPQPCKYERATRRVAGACRVGGE